MPAGGTEDNPLACAFYRNTTPDPADPSPFDPATVVFEGKPVASLLRDLETGTDEQRVFAARCATLVWFGLSTCSHLSGCWGVSREEVIPLLEKVKQGKVSARARVLVPPLVRALDDPCADVRAEAACSLMMIGPEALQSCPQLRKALQDESARVRAWSARAIYFVGHELAPAIDASVALLDDPEQGIRAMAAYNLDLMGSDASAARPFLELHLQDPVQDVRDQVRQAIDAIDADRSKR